MIAQLQIRVARPVLEFIQHSETVQVLLNLFHAHEPVRQPAESDIDWEDGEPHEDRSSEIAAH